MVFWVGVSFFFSERLKDMLTLFFGEYLSLISLVECAIFGFEEKEKAF